MASSQSQQIFSNTARTGSVHGSTECWVSHNSHHSPCCSIQNPHFHWSSQVNTTETFTSSVYNHSDATHSTAVGLSDSYPGYPIPSLCNPPPTCTEEAGLEAPLPYYTNNDSPHPPSSSTVPQPQREKALRPAPKRGRPRIHHLHSNNDNDDDNDNNNNNNNGPTSRTRTKYLRRVPHNQVERKYREGLKTELERLRRAIPNLPQYNLDSGKNASKPRKVAVLASAIDYIKSVERDRQYLLEEIERMRAMSGMQDSSEGRPNSLNSV